MPASQIVNPVSVLGDPRLLPSSSRSSGGGLIQGSHPTLQDCFCWRGATGAVGVLGWGGGGPTWANNFSKFKYCPSLRAQPWKNVNSAGYTTNSPFPASSLYTSASSFQPVFFWDVYNYNMSFPYSPWQVDGAGCSILFSQVKLTTCSSFISVYNWCCLGPIYHVDHFAGQNYFCSVLGSLAVYRPSVGSHFCYFIRVLTGSYLVSGYRPRGGWSFSNVLTFLHCRWVFWKLFLLLGLR